MPASLPSHRRAVVFDDYREDFDAMVEGLSVQELPLPKLGKGQVLVEMEAAPCNPSDLMFMRGQYGVRKTLPAVPGWEGVGRVIATGGGFMAGMVKGKRVAVGSQSDDGGTWSSHIIADANGCLPVPDDMAVSNAASFLVNPFTAYAFLDQSKKAGHTAIVQTAAASQAGRIVNAIAKSKGMTVLNIIRREDQAEVLKGLGAEHILNSSDPDFEDRLKGEISRLGVTVAFEAVSGPMTGTMFNALPPGGTVYVYGGLDDTPIGNIDRRELIFTGKSITGFFLGTWMGSKNLIQLGKAAKEVGALFKDGTIATSVQGEYALDDVKEALKAYAGNMTAGKILFRP
ncbi:MAG: zinc-binding dehydrogenase [Pseudomonadota bacterium]